MQKLKEMGIKTQVNYDHHLIITKPKYNVLHNIVDMCESVKVSQWLFI